MLLCIENWFLHQWYGTQKPSGILRLLEPVYRAAYQRVRKNQITGSGVYRPRLPLIVVGNITAGGSGKTPLVIHLCRLAIGMGLRPGIASTGYKRHSVDTLLVHADSDPRSCGDEPVMLAQRSGVPVVVATKRREAVKRLNEMDLDLVLSDDGLQGAGLVHDLEFCVVDGERGFGNGHLIPAGPLREPVGRLGNVDHIVSNGIWTGKPDGLIAHVMEFKTSVVRSLDDSDEYSVDLFRHNNTGNLVHAIAGIGHPDRFFAMLETLGLETETHGFTDHHSFRGRDFESIPTGSVILMTEKDAVKCRSLGLKNAWYLPVDTSLPGDFEAKIKDQLAKLVKEIK